jgi:diaminohydroxyphosphoribosylaminopyrimidine deaminase/5-amino-6-(5-phosphoribosylamino)uracil reductase
VPSILEVAAMSRALDHAALGPAHGPNPRVGCVVLDRGGAIVGEGHHRGAGTPHAEVVALAAAGAATRSGTAVVTLEPCNHTGRTGPCTQALIAAGIARVVIAGPDPNPDAAGGAQVLRAAGVDVEVGVLSVQSAALNRRWLFAVGAGRPFVTWKYAATLDGRSAAADGSSQWITGPVARADVQARRAEADAIMVGTGTVLADDPWLTVRDAAGRLAARQPLRVVLGRTPIPATARVRDGAAETLLLAVRDPAEALAALHALQVRHVWLEGGPRLAAAFLRAGLVDEILGYIAPALLGAGLPVVGDLGVTTIGGTHRLELIDVHRLGDDLLMVAAPRRPGPSDRPDRHHARPDRTVADQNRSEPTVLIRTTSA